jgi:hypothetical protein
VLEDISYFTRGYAGSVVSTYTITSFSNQDTDAEFLFVNNIKKNNFIKPDNGKYHQKKNSFSG